MKLIKTEEVIVKKSRFIGYLYEIDSKEEAKEIIDELHKEHKKARHIPYCLVAVVRYFGGIKLGAGGLFRAYMDAANKVCDKNE